MNVEPLLISYEQLELVSGLSWLVPGGLVQLADGSDRVDLLGVREPCSTTNKPCQYFPPTTRSEILKTLGL